MHKAAVEKVIATRVFFSSHFFQSDIQHASVNFLCTCMCSDSSMLITWRTSKVSRMHPMLQASHWDLQMMRILKEWTRINLQQKMNCTASYADTPGTKRGMAIYLDLIPPSFFSAHQSWRKPFLVWQHNILWIQRDNTYSTWGSSGHGYGEIARHQRLASRDLRAVTGP